MVRVGNMLASSWRFWSFQHFMALKGRQCKARIPLRYSNLLWLSPEQSSIWESTGTLKEGHQNKVKQWLIAKVHSTDSDSADSGKGEPFSATDHKDLLTRLFAKWGSWSHLRMSHNSHIFISIKQERTNLYSF